MRLQKLVLLGALLLWALPAAAQTNLTTTTISGAVTNPAQTTVVVASATGITARTTGLFVPATGEWMPVVGVNGTTITVQRGAGALGASPIANSATVIVTPNNAAVLTNRQGNCSGNNLPQYFQLVNVATGDVNICRLTNVWAQVSQLPITQPTTVVLTR